MVNPLGRWQVGDVCCIRRCCGSGGLTNAHVVASGIYRQGGDCTTELCDDLNGEWDLPILPQDEWYDPGFDPTLNLFCQQFSLEVGGTGTCELARISVLIRGEYVPGQTMCNVSIQFLDSSNQQIASGANNAALIADYPSGISIPSNATRCGWTASGSVTVSFS